MGTQVFFYPCFPLPVIISKSPFIERSIAMAFKITFGTDGWRGVIAEDYTFDNVRRCAQGYASYMLE